MVRFHPDPQFLQPTPLYDIISLVTEVTETFFTTVGCMDGRVQEPIIKFGREKFGAKYPDTITEAGLVGILAHNPSREFLSSLKKKLNISIQKHHSKGVVVHGHQECAASDAVDDQRQRGDVRKSVKVIQNLVDSVVSVVGVFVRQMENNWLVEEV